VGWMTRVLFLVGFFSFLCHCIQASSGANLATYSMGTGGSFPGGKTDMS